MAAKVTRRVLLKWAALGATGLAVGACTPPTPQVVEKIVEKEVTAAPKPAGKTITIGWSRHGGEVELLREQVMCEMFAAANPGITVKPMLLAWADYNTKMPVMVAGGQAPDVIGQHPTLMTELYSKKGLRVIDDLVKADNTDFSDFCFPGDTQIEGHTIGMPYTSCAHLMRYNKKLFQEAGLPTPGELFWKGKEKEWNLNAYAAMGPKLTKDLNGDGKIDQYFGMPFSWTTIVAVIRAFGGDVVDEANKKCILNEAKGREALQFMADCARKHKIWPEPQMAVGTLGINFISGKIAVDGATSCNAVRDVQAGKELPFEWDFVPPPAGVAGFRCWGDTGGMSISTTSPNPDACFKWMKFRSSKEVWEETYAKNVVLAWVDSPTRYSLFESKAFLEPLAKLDTKAIRASFEYSAPQPFPPRFVQVSRILQTIVPTEVTNILNGKKTVDEAAKDICTEVQALIDKGV
jgi:multiple sugar transport system substrate-binding protein